MLTTSIWTETHRYLKIHPPSHISTVVHQVTAIEKTFEDALKPITHHYRYVYKYTVQICRLQIHKFKHGFKDNMALSSTSVLKLIENESKISTQSVIFILWSRRDR